MIALIFINNLKACPYVDKYIDILKSNNQDFDIIIWDRSWKEGKEYLPECKHVFKKNSPENSSFFKKLIDFWCFRRFVNKVYKKNKYEKIVFLSTLSAFMLSKKYRNNLDYVLDYRDVSYERISFFNYLLKKIINDANFVAISSKGFLSILPQSTTYVMAHNFRYFDYVNFNQKAMNKKYEKSKSINVAYIGLVRHLDYIKMLIDIFGNDSRFKLNINGGGEILDEVIEYAKQFDNIICSGSYNNNEKYQYILNADILCYNYLDSFGNHYALANKYYDGIIYKKPLLGNIFTYSGKLITDTNMGVSLDMNDKFFKDKLIEYYKNLDSEDFVNNANRIMEKIISEDIEYLAKIKEFYNG